MAREDLRSNPVQPPVEGGLDLDLTIEQIQTIARKDPERALRILELKEKLETRVKHEEQKIRLSQEQRQKLEAIDAQIQATYAMQQNCPHLKENGRPAIGGIRDSGNNTHYICLRCSKEWINSELPHHLRSNLSEIGGPQYA